MVMDKILVLTTIEHYEKIEELAEQIAERVREINKVPLDYLHFTDEIDIGQDIISVLYTSYYDLSYRLEFPTSYLWDDNWEKKEMARFAEKEKERLRKKREEEEKKLRIMAGGDESKYQELKKRFGEK
jgi:hypothetical protein